MKSLYFNDLYFEIINFLNFNDYFYLRDFQNQIINFAKY